MKDQVLGAAWRFAVFTVACVFGIVALFAIFGQLRFQVGNLYHAHFANTSGLKRGDFVRIGGVEVGRVDAITWQPDSTLIVEFTAERSVVLTEATRAVVRYDNLIGDRHLALEEGGGSTRNLPPGATIPLAKTQPALDLDALIGGFRPLFRALDPDQVNELSAQLIAIFQGQGSTISSFLAHTASITNTLADRDQLIGQVIGNLNTVLDSLSDQSEQFGTTVTALSDLVDGLAARRVDISTGLAKVDAAAAEVAALLQGARPALKEAVIENDRASGTVLADHEYFDDILNTLPDKYRLLERLGLHGDYFSFYLCDVVLKLNGKGGQPVRVKVAGQDTGRCAPK